MMTRQITSVPPSVVVQPGDLHQVNALAALLAETLGASPSDAASAGGCARCTGMLSDGLTTARSPLRRAGLLVVTNVPARICDACGETVLAPATSRQLEAIEADSSSAGQVDYRLWAPALPFDLGRTA